MNRMMTLAMYRMLFETCGEDPELLENAVITPISDNEFHVQYKEKDPYDGLDLKVKITFDRAKRYVEGITRYRDIAKYEITESVWGDNGSFEIIL